MKKTLTYVLTALMAGLVLMLGAPAASAHGGAIKLEVTGDGADNVNVLATYKKDGHPVTEIVEATLSATSADGRSFGPVPLRSAPEGQNLYHAAEPLPNGDWKVTVTATEPAKAATTVKVKAGEISVSPVAATGPASASAQSKAAAAADDEGAMGMPLKIGIIALVALLAVAAFIGLARRNRASVGR
ncbi:hypothetical protein ACIBK1_35620 [Microbispora rosea]|uniref:CopC domain-containing protein n=1 Tax=Microbispora rosea TaxID=58117 RepID=A0A1N7HIF7_9ACTN|nr:hypothetical protein [Microbispora rosea]GIH52898.1 hypothetical protein Mro03_80770 [Microbispora rosea subsp. rosea]SIS24657.1 hypothetical protein SAMN05421833_1533 [Microbispora rosea]